MQSIVEQRAREVVVQLGYQNGSGERFGELAFLSRIVHAGCPG
jgi:hypothetical protein